ICFLYSSAKVIGLLTDKGIVVSLNTRENVRALVSFFETFREILTNLRGDNRNEENNPICRFYNVWHCRRCEYGVNLFHLKRKN
ncbi:hypothetical protein AB4574_25055, partial [Vibrio sp. 10N.222.49.E5]|uniref:hypothetical protein n=1 Tax=Vibrio sp. 10N.222.49.E5 TaxID=3229617 RepID=UPI00354BA94C